MYEAYFGLKEKPFELLPDPDFLYMSEGHEDTYVHLDYAIQEGKGFVVVTGEIGAGKTTLVNLLLERLPQEVEVAVISNTAVSASHFVRLTCQGFGLPTQGLDKAELLDSFKNYLLEQSGMRRRVVLLVDEAQNLSPRTIEEIRLLSNLEADRHHLLQIILVGQPELRRKLREKGLEQFLQRVSAHCHLEALGTEEVGDYILHRLRIAGAGQLALFEDAAIEMVARHSGGIPRVINSLCDSALLTGYADGLRVITGDVIEEVAAARAAGGLFTDTRPSEEERQGTVGDARLADEIDTRLSALEGRTREILNTLEGLQQEVSALAQEDERLAKAFEVLLRRTRARLQSFSAAQPSEPTTAAPAKPTPARASPPEVDRKAESSSLLAKLVNRM